jgi:putative SOS response-associated peptidase YedK
MCGRFTLRAPASVIAEQFAVFAVPPFAARFNIAPTQPVPVIRLRPAGAAAAAPNADRELVWLRWGLVPGWAKDPAIGNRLINARAESAAEKPAFRNAMRRRRCLVLADGFYEWQHTGRKKQPYFVHLPDDRPFAFAGLWEAWEGPNHAMLETCTILTTNANELVRPLHDRMPVILPPPAYARWLDPAISDPRQLAPLLAPYPSEQIEAYPVGSAVNTAANDTPGCVEKLSEEG